MKTLSHGPLHGYAITMRIQELSRDVLQVEEGSLYPALHRMEQEGWIASEWALSETNRRVRYYKLTAKGAQQLKAEEREWERVTEAIARVLRYA